MSERARYEIPAGLREAQQRFEKFRNSHSGRKKLPEPLWALAAQLAVEHGVFRTAQVLRLAYASLQQRVRASAPITKSPATQPAFVELVPAAAAHACECTIEIEGPRGRMRIEWKGATAPDLAALSRTLWEQGA